MNNHTSSRLAMRIQRAYCGWSKLLVWCMITLLGFSLISIAFSRSYPSFGVETDYLATFVPEARRILAGGPLMVQWHPPLYPLALASVHLLIGDWFATGLIISIMTSLAAAWLAFILLRGFLGIAAGVGALFGCLASGPFLSMGSSASSDTFFLALFFASLLAAHRAIGQPSARRWAVCGVWVGLALLTRSNALTLALLAAAPLLLDGPSWRRLERLLGFVGGATVPLLVWSVIALATGSPLVPQGSADNLAMTFYASGDRISMESMRQVTGEFSGILDVLTRDPLQVLIIYTMGLVSLVRSGLIYLIAPPLNLFIGAALMMLILTRRDRVALGLIIILFVQVLLLNLKTFEQRHYLFLVPFIGSGLVMFAWVLTARLADRSVRRTIATCVGLCGVVAVSASLAEAIRTSRLNQAELSEAVISALDIIPSGASVVARKPHIGFMVGAETVVPPSDTSPESVGGAMAAIASAGPVFLYYGAAERAYWPELSALADPRCAPVGLVVEAQGAADGGWVLYRYSTEEAPALREEDGCA
ncbi:MAG: glycosyltransferase family 39 protein [Rhodospirillales bacterium]|nr:glycosyltransferase family 39 protein [Rhodospirillales bacterium]